MLLCGAAMFELFWEGASENCFLLNASWILTKRDKQVAF